MATSQKRSRVLVVDDEPAMREVLLARLSSWGFNTRCAGDLASAVALIDSFVPDVIVTDLVLPDGTGIDLLRSHHRPDRKFVVITAYGTVSTAVDAMKGGAVEFLTKPLDYAALRDVLEAEAARVERRAASPPRAEVAHRLVGSSPAMLSLRREVDAVAAGRTTVMLVGESGTGKELVAKSIHEASERADRPFVAVNAAAIPASLVEAELLGHERGAFTGAESARPGVFEQAHTGTLFLDEITEMPTEVQAKLLRVLEDGRVRRVGATTEIVCDVRVIAATNRSPERAVEEHRLRMDLYHRLCVFRLDIPPLRARLEDLPELTTHLVDMLCERDARRPSPKLTEAALDRLAEHHYPGNVRELRNLLERALVFARGEVVDTHHLQLESSSPSTTLVKQGITIPAGMTAAEAERVLIVETLKRVGNNKAEAARRLGLDVKTIRNKLKTFDREG